jgi:hypothetical protein
MTAYAIQLRRPDASRPPLWADGEGHPTENFRDAALYESCTAATLDLLMLQRPGEVKPVEQPKMKETK